MFFQDTLALNYNTKQGLLDKLYICNIYLRNHILWIAFLVCTCSHCLTPRPKQRLIEMACVKSFGGVHTAMTQKQIPIGFWTPFIGVCVCLDLGIAESSWHHHPNSEYFNLCQFLKFTCVLLTFSCMWLKLVCFFAQLSKLSHILKDVMNRHDWIFSPSVIKVYQVSYSMLFKNEWLI